MEDIVKATRNRILLPTNRLVELIHKNDHYSFPQLNEMLKELQNSASNLGKSSQESTQNGSNIGTNGNNNYANGKMEDQNFDSQRYLRSLVINQMARYLPPNKLKEDTFPGPMASQLIRNKFHLVRDNKYYITEKSDGVRCMMATFFKERFPRWLVHYTKKDKNNKLIPRKFTFGLKETIFLEIQVESGKFNVPFEFKWIDGEVKKVQLERDSAQQNPFQSNHAPQSSKIYLRVFNTQENDSNGGSQNGTLHVLEKLYGRQFSYVFDRTFQFHLCIEEFMFLVKGKNFFQSIVILDGEIVWNFPQKRYNYSIYDIVTMSVDKAIAVSVFGMNPNEVGQNQVISVPCGQYSLEDKIKFIKENIFEPYYAYYGTVGQDPPSSLQLIVKHFYEKNEIEDLLQLIVKKSGVYYYKEYNKNDGFVFTPAYANLYRFEPGTAKNLVKWKWPDKLTADFLGVVRERNEQNQTTVLDLYYQYFESSRRKDPNYNGHTVLFKTVDLKKQWSSLSETTIKDLSVKESCIVECFFDDRLGDWEIHMVRKDKVKANSYNTIISTLTNVMEDIKEDDLKNICLNRLDDKLITEQDIIFEKTLRNKNVFITLKLKATNGVYFHCGHPIREKLSFNKMLTSLDIIGPSGESGNDLDDLCYQMFDEEYLYPRLIFEPTSGYWKIIDFHGKEEDTSSVKVLQMIETMTSTILQTKRTLNISDSVIDNLGEKRKREENDILEKRQRVEF